MDYLSQLNNSKALLLNEADALQAQTNAYISSGQQILQAKIDDIGSKLEQGGEFILGAFEFGSKVKSIYDKIKNPKNQSQSEEQTNQQTNQETTAEQQETTQPAEQEMNEIIPSETPNQPVGIQETNMDQAAQEEESLQTADNNPSINADPVDEASSEITADITPEATAEATTEATAEAAGEATASTIGEVIGGSIAEAIPVVGEIIGAGLFISGLITSIFEGEKEEKEEQEAIQNTPRPPGITQIISTVGSSAAQLQETASGALNYII